MNEFVGKKLGEVAAFSRLGIETLIKGQNSLSPILAVTKTIAMLEDQEKKIIDLASAYGFRDITLEKAQKTKDKIIFMRDHYIGNEWDNPTEILEWLGFFEGAAVAHWFLIQGVAEGLGDQALKDLASFSTQQHQDLFDVVNQSLSKIGSIRVTE